MISREDLPSSELLSDYVDQGYNAYRRFLATRSQLKKRKKMSPGNAETYNRILGRAGKSYADTIRSLQHKAQRVIDQKLEALESDRQAALDAYWQRVRDTLGKGDAAAADALRDQVKNSSWEEIEELYNNGDEWVRAIVRTSMPKPNVDYSTVEGMQSNAANVHARILAETDDQQYEADLADLKERSRTIRQAHNALEAIDPLAHAKAQDNALDGVAGIHHRALQAEPDDFSMYERHTAMQSIERDWKLITASLPSDWEARAEAEAAS
jgi:hypothetical protein